VRANVRAIQAFYTVLNNEGMEDRDKKGILQAAGVNHRHVNDLSIKDDLFVDLKANTPLQYHKQIGALKNLLDVLYQVIDFDPRNAEQLRRLRGESLEATYTDWEDRIAEQMKPQMRTQL